MRLSHWLNQIAFRLGMQVSHKTTRARRKDGQNPSIETLEDRCLLANWSGDIPNGTVWSAGEVHRIVADARVPAGSTLTVQPGAVVKFEDFNRDLIIDGTLLAQGTTGSPIIFTALRDDTGGDTNGDGSATTPVNGGWGRIEFSASSTGSILDHVDVRYGGSGAGGQIVVNGGQLALTNSTIRNSATTGVRVQNANPTLTNLSFQNNTTSAVGMNLESDPAITGPTMSNNGWNGLLIDSGTIVGNRIWNDPDIVISLANDITVAADATLTIGAGQIVKKGAFVDFTINGTLNATGTTTTPVIFTELRDDTAGGDSNNDGNSTTPLPNSSNAIRFVNSPRANVLDHVEVRYGAFGDTGAVVVRNSSLDLSNSLIRQSGGAGVRIEGSSPIVRNSQFNSNAGAAFSMDLQSKPVFTGNVFTNNSTNGLVLDGGNITVNQDWNNPEVVYCFSGDVIVNEGVTLTIAPGQIVKWQPLIELFVGGTLKAEGTVEAPILFTDRRDDTAGGDTNNNGTANVPLNGSRIEILSTSQNSVLDHVELRHGGVAFDAALVVDGAEVTFSNGNVNKSVSEGILAKNGAVVHVQNSLLHNNAGGGIVATSKATVYAINNTSDQNGHGILADGIGTNVQITNNLLTNNKVAGITQQNQASTSVSFNSVFNPTATRGNYNGLPDAGGSNGNLSTDPLYVDRVALDFRLQATSPAIDSATSTGAPVDDFAFNFRVDTQSVSNSGTGAFPFYDRGALEFAGRPRAAKHTPHGEVTRGVSSVTITFRSAMDRTTFSVASDIVSFTGPAGPLAVSSFAWLNSYQLKLSFLEQGTAGSYAIVLGPDVLNTAGLALDVDGDGIRGESTDDRYVADWTVLAPQIIGKSVADVNPAPVTQIDFTFDRPMNPGSFSIEQDVRSFTGPAGNIAIDGFSWPNSSTLRLTFPGQSGLGPYELRLGPNVSDLFANNLDQNRNGLVGEDPGDVYTARFTLAEIIHVSGEISTNTTWSGIVLVDGAVSIQPDVTLTINPGTIVKFADDTGITVRAGALLNSNGTNAQPVIITSIHDDTHGGDNDLNGDAVLAQAGDWLSVLFESSTGHFESTRIMFGGGSTTGVWSSSGMLRTIGSSTLTVSRSLLQDAFFDAVLTMGGTTTMTNSVVTGADRGIVSWLENANVQVINSTVVDNRIGILAHGGTTNVVNSIISHNLQFGIDNDINPDPTVSHTNIFSLAGSNVRGFTNPIGTNGNLSVDPLFVNLEGRDYRLGSATAVIDAANSSVSPETDFLNAPRVDTSSIPNTGTPTSTGEFADLGAFEYTAEASSNIDLQPTVVTAPATGFATQEINLQWTVRNLGSDSAVGTWHDTVYLSTDQNLSADDVVLKQVSKTGPLAAAQSYQVNETVSLPAITPRRYYFLVRANSDEGVFEGQNRGNNLVASTSTTEIDLQIPTLSTDSPINGAFTHAGEVRYYKVTVPADQTIAINLASAAASGRTELFLSAGQLPTAANSDFKSTEGTEASRTLYIPRSIATTYYLMVRATEGAAANSSFTLTADIPGFTVQTVSPGIVGNTGEVTISIQGTSLTNITQVSLISEAGVTIAPAVRYFEDATQVYATFNLSGVAEGKYDVRVHSRHQIFDHDSVTGEIVEKTKIDGDMTLPDKLQVVTGTTPKVVPKLIMPDAARVGRAYPFSIEITNEGNVDAPSPLFLVHSSDGSPVSTAQTVNATGRNQLQVMAVGRSAGRASVLAPGEKVVIPLFGFAENSTETLLSVQDLTAPELPIEWSSMEPYYRDDSPVDVWNTTWSNFQGIVGDTWGELHDVMRLSVDSIGHQQNESYVAGDELMERLFDRAEDGQNDISQFSPVVTIIDDNEDLNIPSTGTTENVVFVESPPVTPVSADYGDAYRPRSAAELAYDTFFLTDTLLPFMLATAGADVASIIFDYLNAGAPTFRTISPGSSIVTGFGLRAGLAEDPIVLTVANTIFQHAATAIRGKANSRAFVESLPANADFSIDLTELVNPANLDSTSSGGPNAIKSEADYADDLEFESNSIASIIAGGIGKYDPVTGFSQGSDVYGDDVRKISGFMVLRRNVVDGKTTSITFHSRFRFYIKDTFDFCPGALGDSFLVRRATIPMAELEANGHAWDQGFEVEFSVDPLTGSIPISLRDEPPSNIKDPDVPDELDNIPPDVPDDEPEDVEEIEKVSSFDPNDISGPAGVGAGRHILPTDLMPYRINFENDPERATAPAQDVVITNSLDTDMDLDTFELRTVGFGSVQVEIPAGLQSYTTTVDYTNLDGTPLLVEVSGELNRSTRIVTWSFKSLDPETLLPPLSPTSGFLPPNDDTHRGEGFVTYTIRPLSSLGTGVVIENSASIVFDVNEPLLTNVVFNTIDSGAPSSAVNALPNLSANSFTVTWSGSDDSGGSGIASYDVFVSIDGSDFTLWQSGTASTSATYTGEPGKSYAFRSVARDALGHQEAGGSAADATTTVEVNTAPSIAPGQSFTVTGSASVGALVGKVLGSDSNVTTPNNSISYSISSGNSSGAFTIDGATGEIRVLNSAVLRTLGGTTTTLQVTVTDGGLPGLTGSNGVAVIVNSVDNAPVLSNPGPAPTFVVKDKTAVPVVPTILITDADGTSSIGQVVISMPALTAKKKGDLISITNVAIFGELSESTLGDRTVFTITINQGITNQQVQQLLQSVLFKTGKKQAKIPTRDFQFQVFDRSGLASNFINQVVTIVKKNKKAGKK